MGMLIGAGFTLLWSLALWTDLKERKIPNWLTCGFAIAGVTLQVSSDGWTGLQSSCLGMGIGLAITLPFYLFRAVGAGDVKLFWAAGAWIGAWHAILLWGYTILLAGCIGIVWLIWEEHRTKRMRNWCLQLLLLVSTRDRAWLSGPSRQRVAKMPLMLAAAPGAVLLYLRHIFE